MLTVVIPAYNASDHLSVAVNSVASLLGPNVELIIVDDGSIDHTADTFEQLRISLGLVNSQIIRQEHAGVSVARNHGATLASGQYIIFLDSDDRLAACLPEKLHRAAESTRPDIICWGWDVVGADGKPIRRYFDVHPEIPTHMSGVEALRRRTVDRSLRLWTASAAYRRGFIESACLRFTPGCATGEGLEFGYMALLRARVVEFIPQVLSIYQKRAGSVSLSPSAHRLESVLALRRVSICLEGDPRPEVREIGRHFDRTKVLVNYFHTLESCLALSGARSPRAFLNTVERVFPGLNRDICESLRCMRVATAGVPFEWRVFAASPEAWWQWLRIRRFVDLLLPRRFRSTGAASERRRTRLLES